MLRAIVQRTVLWVVLPLIFFIAITPTETRSASCLAPIGKDQKPGRLFPFGFHAASDGTLLISTEEGLFRRAGDNLVPIGMHEKIGGIFATHEASDGMLIGAYNGLFRRAGNNLVEIGKDQKIGRAYAFLVDRDGTLLISTIDNGLFRRAGDNLVPIGKDQKIGRVDAFHLDRDGTLLIGATNGLFRRDGDNLVEIGKDQTIGRVIKIHETSDGMLIGAWEGLFRRTGDNLVPIGKDQSTGPIWAFHEASDHTLLVGSTGGLFRRDGDNLVPIGKEHKLGSVDFSDFHVDRDGALLIRAEEGLFRRDGDNLVPIMVGRSIKIHKASELIGTQEGLFRRAGDKLVSFGKNQTGSIQEFYQAPDGTLFIVSQRGLFRRSGNDVMPILMDQTNSIRQGHVDRDGTLLISTDEGLFREMQLRWAEAIVSSENPLDVNRGVRTEFIWTVTHPCVFALTETEISLSGIPKSWIINKITLTEDKPNSSKTVHAIIAFADKKDVPFEVALRVKEDTGKSVPLGHANSVRVDWPIVDVVKYYGSWVSLSIGVLHTGVFVLLIVSARWSAFSWRVLTDPVWGRIGLWFYFALRHINPLQRWIMARWFDAVRQKTSRKLYLPMSLNDDEGPVGRSTDLLDPNAKWERLWVQGNAGMGKTAMVLYVQSAFFVDPKLPTLSDAFARFRIIPIIIPLREYRHVAFDPSHPENWVPSVARMVVSAFGVPFGNDSLFRAMLKSGGFLLVLDGANEVERNEAIELFARSASAVRLLVTSQLPGSRYFTNWHLPYTMHDQIGPLLRLFLGPETDERIFARIKSIPLLNDIRSGYDVRLIADLVKDEGQDVALPADRLGLYQLILDAIRMPADSKFPQENLCRAAWVMWRDGERKLEAGKHLDGDLLAPLIHEDQKVLRILDGQKFEFRHDQMRAYLAACWAARHEANPISLFESESASAIWRLSRTEQEEVWNFFADMYVADRPQEATALWNWSIAHPERAILQHALLRALIQTGLDPQMATPAENARPTAEPKAVGAAAMQARVTVLNHPGTKPPGIAAPELDKADDLKLIKGIGPRNERRLNGLGIWHFAQIATWSAENVKWVGSYLAFPGRIDREKWIDQARELATVHKAELSNRFGS